jgi:hypothetical protein
MNEHRKYKKYSDDQLLDIRRHCDKMIALCAELHGAYEGLKLLYPVVNVYEFQGFDSRLQDMIYPGNQGNILDIRDFSLSITEELEQRKEGEKNG